MIPLFLMQFTPADSGLIVREEYLVWGPWDAATVGGALAEVIYLGFIHWLVIDM